MHMETAELMRQRASFGARFTDIQDHRGGIPTCLGLASGQMIYINANGFKPGMILGAPLRHPGVPTHTLLRAGYRLETRSIARLHRLEVEAAWIRKPGFECLDGKIGDAIPQNRVELYNCVKQSFEGISNKTAGSFDLEEYRNVINNMLLALIANKDNAVWADRLMSASCELFSHCANVAYLSLVIGMRLQTYIAQERKFVKRSDARDLTNLGIGAMLHDLGKLGLDSQWRDTHAIGPESDSDEYRSHAERGYRAVQGQIESTAAQVLLHHHQRFDGQGFPQPENNSGSRTVKLPGGHNIHIFSRIVAVANTVDALTAAAKRDGLPLVSALSSLRSYQFEGTFDPKVLGVALRVIPPFPLGSVVKLSSGQEAVVVDLNDAAPCFPKVWTLTDSARQEDEIEEIDLSQSGGPCIVQAGDSPVDPDCFYDLACQPVTAGN